MGTALQVRARLELVRAGVDIQGATAPFEPQYMAAYNQYLATPRAQRRSPRTRDEAAHRFATRAMVALFHQPTTRTSTTNEPYSEYYGKGWDRVRSSK